MLRMKPPTIRKAVHQPPSCKTCKFYQAGECKAFAIQEPVTGQVMYLNAIDVRSNPRMCGPDGNLWLSKDMYPSLR